MIRPPWPNPPKQPRKRGLYRKLNASRRQLAPSLQPPVTLTISHIEGGDFINKDVKVSVVSQIPGADYNGPTHEVDVSIKRSTGVYSSLMSLLSNLDVLQDITFVDCNYPGEDKSNTQFARLCLRWLRQDLKQIARDSKSEHSCQTFRWDVTSSTTQDLYSTIDGLEVLAATFEHSETSQSSYRLDLHDMTFYSDRDMLRQIVVESFIRMISTSQNGKGTGQSWQKKFDILAAFSHEIYNFSSLV